MGKKIYISELEKACICYMYFTGQKIKNAYSLSHGGKTVSNPTISGWVNSDPVKAYLLELKQRDAARMSVYDGQTESGKEKENEKEGNGIQLKQIDFTNVGEFIKYLNNQANTITDESHRQKYLSMLSDLLRFKESGTDKSTDIQRFYIPITCKDCQLYKDSKNK